MEFPRTRGRTNLKVWLLYGEVAVLDETRRYRTVTGQAAEPEGHCPLTPPNVHWATFEEPFSSRRPGRFIRTSVLLAAGNLPN